MVKINKYPNGEYIFPNDFSPNDYPILGIVNLIKAGNWKDLSTPIYAKSKSSQK